MSRGLAVALLLMATSAPIAAAQPDATESSFVGLLSAVVFDSPGGQMRASIAQGPERRRRLTIECIDDCSADAPHYADWFDDYPVSMIRLGDATSGFCVLSTGGSAYHFDCYAVGADVRRVVETGFRQLVSLSYDELVYVDEDGDEVQVSLRELPDHRDPPGREP